MSHRGYVGGIADGGTGRTFRLTVSFHHRDAEHTPEEDHYAFRQGGRSTDHEAEVVQPQCLFDFIKNEPIVQPVGELAVLESLGLGGNGGVKQFLLDSTGCIDAGLDLVVYFVQDARRGGQHGRSAGLQIFHQQLGIAAEETHGGPRQQYLGLDHPLKDMRQGQVGQMPIEGLGLDEALHGPDGAHEILMREEGTLGIAGGTAGVAEGGNVLAGGGRVLMSPGRDDLSTDGLHLGERNDVQANLLGHSGGIGDHPINQHDVTEGIVRTVALRLA